MISISIVTCREYYIYNHIIGKMNSISLRCNDYCIVHCSILQCIQILIAHQVADILDMKLFDSIKFS